MVRYAVLTLLLLALAPSARAQDAAEPPGYRENLRTGELSDWIADSSGAYVRCVR